MKPSVPADWRGNDRLRRIRILFETLLLGLLIGVFVGVFSDRYNREPAVTLREGLDTFVSLADVIDKAWFSASPSTGNSAPRGPIGVTRYSATSPGLVLAATGGPEVTLFADDGSVLHRWRVPVESLFTIPALLRADDVSINGYQLLPDGGLIAIAIYEPGFPAFNLGDVTMNSVLVKIDAQSTLVWAYHGNPHHDLAVTETGEIDVLVARDGVVPARKGGRLPEHFRDEGIAILDADGTEKRTIWLSEALAQSPYAGLEAGFGSRRCYDDTQYYCWDLFHANSVEVVSRAVAAKLPMVQPGDLLVNLRSLDSVLVIDPATERVRWAMHGSWHRAHDANFTSAGTLMLFDNRGDVGGTTPSRVVEIDPRNGATLWQYDGGQSHPFNSAIRGNAEPLDNGDVLITESMGGRIFEVTREGRIAWEYVSPPARNSTAAPVLWGGRRIDPAGYPFLKDLQTAANGDAHDPSAH